MDWMISNSKKNRFHNRQLVGAIFYKSLQTAYILLLFTISACSSEDFQSSNQVPKLIQEHLKYKEYFEEDFLKYPIVKDNKNYCPEISSPYWIIPSAGLSDSILIRRSNNNVSIAFYNDKLFVAFRTAPTHFASKKTGVNIISSLDGLNWEKELSLFLGKDVREPYLIPINDTLHFYFFTAGIKMTAFEPQSIEHFVMNKQGNWSAMDNVLEKGEVHWSMKRRNNKVFMTSYEGAHYKLKGESAVRLHFRNTQDGSHFPPKKDSSVVYIGGVSECAFEFDYKGNLWAVSRLEDGDQTGFGAHVIFADKDSLYNWQFPKEASSNIYMSPKMFNHNDELYLIARKQLGRKPFGKTSRDKSLAKQRFRNWVGYSLTPKTTALFKIDQVERKVEWLMDLPGVGDTAFPSIVRLSKNRFLVANYSSPIHKRKKRSWLSGQLGKTGIYLIVIEFKPCEE